MFSFFFVVDILSNGNQQNRFNERRLTKYSKRNVTGEQENSRETIFIPSFSCPVNCIRIQYVHIYSVIG